MSRKGGVERKIGERTSWALRAFGAIWKPIFKDKDPSVTIKQLVYVSHFVVLRVSLTCSSRPMLQR